MCSSRQVHSNGLSARRLACRYKEGKGDTDTTEAHDMDTLREALDMLDAVQADDAKRAGIVWL